MLWAPFELIFEYNIIQELNIMPKNPDQLTITIPAALKKRAKKSGLNVSAVAREALLKRVLIIEQSQAGSS